MWIYISSSLRSMKRSPPHPLLRALKKKAHCYHCCCCGKSPGTAAASPRHCQALKIGDILPTALPIHELLMWPHGLCADSDPCFTHWLILAWTTSQNRVFIAHPPPIVSLRFSSRPEMALQGHLKYYGLPPPFVSPKKKKVRCGWRNSVVKIHDVWQPWSLWGVPICSPNGSPPRAKANLCFV